MIKRILKPSKSQSFFIFGARGTGKSTFIQELKEQLGPKTLIIDLLDPAEERELAYKPEKLKERVEAVLSLEKPSAPLWVIIDEIQKVPKLLDCIHQLIFEKKALFVLTGSSARKLKRDSANLLAGRAFSYFFFPFSHLELGSLFNLQATLSFGTLPGITPLAEESDKKRFLLSYIQNYIKEEILVEQLVRNLDPFRAFLEVAAQSNSEIINAHHLAREASINPKSVERYFSILEDTLIGFFLEPFAHSIRKRQIQAPKFYFFDCGVTRALSGQINTSISEGTYEYGKLFEQFVIVEIFKLNHYLEKNWKLSYLKTGAGVEIDLIIEKSKKEIILIEIKSTASIKPHNAQSLKKLSIDFPQAKKYVLSRDTTSSLSEDVYFLHWQEGLKVIFDVNTQRTHSPR